MSSSSLPSNEPVYNLRRYQPSQDDQGIKDLFTNNIIEEWGTRYHNGIYIENAKRYIDSVVNDSDSDMNNIEQTYFCRGGYFWVLTYCANCDDGNREEIIVGTCGLQRISDTEAELRRVCMAQHHRSQGWGSKMVQLAMERVKTHEEMANVVQKVVVSTIEHSIDGIDFYKTKHGFVDTIDEKTGLPKKTKAHGTPINEVFMEYKI